MAPILKSYSALRFQTLSTLVLVGWPVVLLHLVASMFSKSFTYFLCPSTATTFATSNFVGFSSNAAVLSSPVP